MFGRHLLSTGQERNGQEAHLREGLEPGSTGDEEMLLEALEQLPPDQRAVLRVRLMDGQSVAAAAETLGLPPSEIIRLQAQALVAVCRVLDAR